MRMLLKWQTQYWVPKKIGKFLILSGRREKMTITSINQRSLKWRRKEENYLKKNTRENCLKGKR